MFTDSRPLTDRTDVSSLVGKLSTAVFNPSYRLLSQTTQPIRIESGADISASITCWAVSRPCDTYRGSQYPPVGPGPSVALLPLVSRQRTRSRDEQGEPVDCCEPYGGN